METLGERVKRLREERNMTQQQLADKAGVGQSTVNGIEKGARQKMPSSLVEIAHALRVDAYYLKTGTGSNPISSHQLNDEQSQLLEGFALFGEELKSSWLATAKSAIDKAAESKKAFEAEQAAIKKAA